MASQQLIICLVAVAFSGALADINISLEPMAKNITDTLDDFAGLFFQPFQPVPSTPLNCYDRCPCSMDPMNVTDCLCDVEATCGGALDVNLESAERINFNWDASADDTKFVSIVGKGRTRIEFQMTVDCGSGFDEYKYSEYDGDSLSYSFQFVTEDGFDDADGQAQSYTFNSGRTFVSFGKCDGCSECEVYTRLQLDPGSDGLKLFFKSVTFSTSYDNTLVLEGTNTYDWSTSGYCWMRDSDKGRHGRENERLARADDENEYEIKSLPNGAGNGSTPNGNGNGNTTTAGSTTSSTSGSAATSSSMIVLLVTSVLPMIGANLF
jgi:hypothetical protein